MYTVIPRLLRNNTMNYLNNYLILSTSIHFSKYKCLQNIRMCTDNLFQDETANFAYRIPLLNSSIENKVWNLVRKDEN